MQALAYRIQDTQPDPSIWGGPLSLRIVTDRAFGGVIPDPKDDEIMATLKGFVHDCLLGRNCPPGELKFIGRSFHYRAELYIVGPRYVGNNPLLRFWDRGRRRRVEFWRSEDAAGYLEACWVEEFGHLLEMEEKPKDAEPLLITSADPAPVKTEKPALWDETRMAEAMGLPEAVFVERLESGYWCYRYSQRVEGWDESRRPLKVVKYRYSFTEAVRNQNIKNRDKRKKIEEGD